MLLRRGIMFGLGKKCKEGHNMDPTWKVCPVCLGPVCGWLVGLDDFFKYQVFTIHEGVSKIGHGTDCELRIPTDKISQYHASLSYSNKRYILSDRKSSSGTYVNDNQIRDKDVTDADIIKFGNISFKLKCLW